MGTIRPNKVKQKLAAGETVISRLPAMKIDLDAVAYRWCHTRASSTCGACPTTAPARLSCTHLRIQYWLGSSSIER
jgi:hypothetical protein